MLLIDGLGIRAANHWRVCRLANNPRTSVAGAFSRTRDCCPEEPLGLPLEHVEQVALSFLTPSPSPGFGGIGGVSCLEVLVVWRCLCCMDAAAGWMCIRIPWWRACGW